MSASDRQSVFRKWVTGAFSLVSVLALAVFSEAIGAFLNTKGLVPIINTSWRTITNLGLGDVVIFALLFLFGATVALWTEFWFRDRREAKKQLARVAFSCTAKFSFSEDTKGIVNLALDERSENVAYYAWYLNNGGTMRNTAVMVFVEFDKEISSPVVSVHSEEVGGEWQEFATTDRFTFVELKGWPKGEVVVQAMASKLLGLDRRSELKVWRPYSPVS